MKCGRNFEKLHKIVSGRLWSVKFSFSPVLNYLLLQGEKISKTNNTLVSLESSTKHYAKLFYLSVSDEWSYAWLEKQRIID